MMAEKKIALEVKNLSKKFGNKTILDNITFNLYEGEVLALFGGSGTGKSVTLRTIIGLEHADTGEIIYQGKDLTKLSEFELFSIRQKISYVFQNGALFDSMTVADNLAYPLREHTTLDEVEIMAQVKEMLDLISLGGSEELLPSSLSGGMQKRVGLARAIIIGPHIILYDEPTAGLDPTNTKNLLALINKLKNRGSTGIFVTHDIPAAFEIADRIAIMSQGRIHTIDTIDNIKNSQDPVVKGFILGERLANNGSQVPK